jgi:hypothetical protein
MRRTILIIALLSAAAARADDSVGCSLIHPCMTTAEQPIDPVAVVKQLYGLSNREYGGSASYEIWGDGSVHFMVRINRDTYIAGSGNDAKTALEDLKRQSEIISDALIPAAEKARTSTQSLTEAIKAILFGGRSSQ